MATSPISLDVFAISPLGFDCHLQINTPTLAEALVHVDALAKAGFTPKGNGGNRDNGSKPASVPATVEAPRPAAPVHDAEAPAPTPIRAVPQGETCPEHDLAAISKFGGLYCPFQEEGGTYCSWKTRPAKVPVRKASGR